MRGNKLFLIVVAAVIVVAVYIFFAKKVWRPTANKSTVAVQQDVVPKGRQCYTYDHEATKDAPYTVHEHIDMTISGATVTGIKQGSQTGPDMSNGYEGLLTGTVEGNTITAVFSYSIEGSDNKEKELYTVRPDQIGIEKMRYPLIEQKDMLVPDTSKPYQSLLYARVGCDASN